MAKGASFDLSKFKLNPDGSYTKISGVQPRDLKQHVGTYVNKHTTMRTSDKEPREPNCVGILKPFEVNYAHPPLIVFRVDAMGKPRMTQSDKWKKREVTDRYWELKDHLKAVSADKNFEMPTHSYHMIFIIKMPDSWARSKKEEMLGKPHQQKPDKDNLEKAVLDALCKEDCTIYDGRVSKFWGHSGQIFIYSI